MARDPHPLLAQIPLTVSPYISLPRAPTLPYTYKPLPSTLPPSSTADAQGVEREKYVVAPSGHSAHPDEIRSSCQKLQAHIIKTQEDAEKTIREWGDTLKAQDLADKRKVAPGWLDRSEKILEPQRLNSAETQMLSSEGNKEGTNIMDRQDESVGQAAASTTRPDPTGEELDRLFGGMAFKPK